MHANKRVVITGIGPVTAIGTGKDQFWENLMDLKAEIRPIPSCFERSYAFKSRYFVPYPTYDFEEYGIPKKYGNIMGDTAKLGTISTILALEDSGLNVQPGSFSPAYAEKAEVLLGVGIGNLNTAALTFLTHIFQQSPEIVEGYQIPAAFNRMSVPTVMTNSASAWISILLGLKGPNHTINASCSSGAIAIGEAFLKVKAGSVPMAIAGGVECLKDQYGCIMRGFDALGALTRSDQGIPMPFSKKRSGFLFAEGAGCILVLEDLDQAVRRGARIYAEIVDYQANSDAFNIVQIDPSGSQIYQLITDITGDHEIQYFNAHGTGTILNDKTESAVILRIFGDREHQPAINSTKGILGHTIGASGAIEIAVTALSIEQGHVHANCTEDPMDNLNLPLKNIDMDIQYALSTSYGFGGHNAAILLKKYKAN